MRRDSVYTKMTQETNLRTLVSYQYLDLGIQDRVLTEVGQFQPAFIEKNYTRSCYKHKNISFIRITISFSISKSEHSDFGNTTAVKTSNFSNLMDGGWQLS
jgi:hypothetical protein